MKWWWARFNIHSIDGLPGLRAAHLVDNVPVGLQVTGADEPPSDGSVVILGNRVPKAGMLERVRAAVEAGVGGWSFEERVRMVVAFSLGLLVAAVYVQVVPGQRGCRRG